MALKEYIGLARLTQAFSLLKSKLDGKENTPTVISYDDFMELTPEQQTSGYYLVVGGTPGTQTTGHTIWNAIKTVMTTRPALWFKDAHVTDDATNSSTNVEIIKDVTSAQFAALATDGSTEGAYNITDEDVIPTDAEYVGYDNTTSGMSANNVQDAIDELNADKVGEWELVGTASGTNSVAIDATTVKEICVVWAWNAIGFSTILPSVFLNNNGAINQIRNGYYQSAGTNEGSAISVSPTSISIVDFFVNGANKVSEATLKVYKR